MSQTSPHILQSHENALIPWWYLISLYVIVLGVILLLYPVVSPLIIIGSIVILALTIYYPEIPLVAFVFIGVTKPWVDENITIFQIIDYTAFLAVYIVLLLFITMIRRSTHTLPSVLQFMPALIILSILLFTGIVYTPASSYGIDKAASFLVFNLLLFIATILYIKDKSDLLRIFTIILIASFFFGIIMLYQGIQSLFDGDLGNIIVRMTILGANPIASARIFSLAFVIVLVTAYYTSKRTPRMFLYVLAAFFLVALIVTNTRGPLVSTFIAVIFFILFLSGMRMKKIAIYMSAFIAIVMSAILFLPDFVTGRYEVLLEVGAAQQALSGVELDTIGARLLMWSMAFSGSVESIWTFLIGHGTGSFASLFPFSELRWYPHNIVAEILYELGVIGVLIFLIHIGQISRYARDIWNKIRLHPEFKTVTAIVVVSAIAAFTAALVSGDINDNRYLWFHFGMVVACWRIMDGQKRKIQH